MLLKVILFAYSEGKQSLSEIEHLNKTDIRYLYLSNIERLTKTALQRLISSLTDTIDNIFLDTSKHIAYDFMLYDEGKMHPRIKKSICVLNQTFYYNFKIKNIYDSLDVGFIVQYLMKRMVFLDIEIKSEIGKRKTKNPAFL